MFSEEINKKELADVASEFKELLTKFSDEYPEAKNALIRASSLISRAINYQIDTPYRQGYFPEEFWEDGTLFEVGKLSNKCAQFNVLLMGAKSLDELRKEVQEIVKQAEIDEKELRNKKA